MKKYTIKYSNEYIKKSSKFIKKHPELLLQYQKTLEILEENPAHSSLRFHRLKGKLFHLHSASINLSYRITLEFYIQENTIIPIEVGSHDEVY